MKTCNATINNVSCEFELKEDFNLSMTKEERDYLSFYINELYNDQQTELSIFLIKRDFNVYKFSYDKYDLKSIILRDKEIEENCHYDHYLMISNMIDQELAA